MQGRSYILLALIWLATGGLAAGLLAENRQAWEMNQIQKLWLERVPVRQRLTVYGRPYPAWQEVNALDPNATVWVQLYDGVMEIDPLADGAHGWCVDIDDIAGRRTLTIYMCPVESERLNLEHFAQWSGRWAK